MILWRCFNSLFEVDGRYFPLAFGFLPPIVAGTHLPVIIARPSLASGGSCTWLWWLWCCHIDITLNQTHTHVYSWGRGYVTFPLCSNVGYAAAAKKSREIKVCVLCCCYICQCQARFRADTGGST